MRRRAPRIPTGYLPSPVTTQLNDYLAALEGLLSPSSAGGVVSNLRPGGSVVSTGLNSDTPIWGQITGHVGALYAWTQVAPVWNGAAFVWLPVDGGGSGTPTVHPARELSGATTVPVDGSYYALLSRGAYHWDSGSQEWLFRWINTQGQLNAGIAEIATCPPPWIPPAGPAVVICLDSKMIMVWSVTLNEWLGYCLCTTSSGTGSSSGAVIVWPGCPSLTIPATLYATFHNSSACPCADGASVTLTYTPGTTTSQGAQNAWVGTGAFGSCGGRTVTIKLWYSASGGSGAGWYFDVAFSDACATIAADFAGSPSGGCTIPFELHVTGLVLDNVCGCGVGGGLVVDFNQ